MTLWKKLGVCFLVAVMLLSLVACDNTKNTENTGDQDSVNSISQAENETENKETENNETEENNAKKELTLDDAQVRMVYAEENYLLLAYYGPHENIGMGYYASDGEPIDAYPYYWQFDSGWRLIETYELPEDVKATDISLGVTDYSDDSQPKRVFSDFGSPMTESELQEIGVCFLNGHACNVSSYGSVYREDITISCEFNWWGADRYTRIDNWPFTTDNFKFFISDGTPLEEAYSDYEMWFETRNVGGGQIWVNLTGNREATNEDFQKLAALQPYMIFTGDDGSTTRIELLKDNWQSTD